MKFNPLKMLGFTIAGLGLTSTAGSQGFLADFIGGFSYVGAASIELAFICLAAITAGYEVKEELAKTARFVVFASVLFNFGHAYQLKIPHGLDTAGPAWDWLAALQAAVVATLIPVIALKLSAIKAKLEEAKEADKAAAKEAKVEVAPVVIAVPAQEISKPTKKAAPRKPRTKKAPAPKVIFEATPPSSN